MKMVLTMTTYSGRNICVVSSQLQYHMIVQHNVINTCDCYYYTLYDMKMTWDMIDVLCREEEMRTVSERTNARVAWFSILSLSVCIVVSVLQLWNLQGFFRKKKLI
jgi:hypothetical protein